MLYKNEELKYNMKHIWDLHMGSLLKCVCKDVSARTDLTKCWRESKYCSLPRYAREERGKAFLW